MGSFDANLIATGSRRLDEMKMDMVCVSTILANANSVNAYFGYNTDFRLSSFFDGSNGTQIEWAMGRSALDAKIVVSCVVRKDKQLCTMFSTQDKMTPGAAFVKEMHQSLERYICFLVLNIRGLKDELQVYKDAAS